MHMIHLVTSEMFQVRQRGLACSLNEVFPDWLQSDRFGIVIDEPFGGLGATQLIQVATTMFYDSKPSRRSERKIYPEIYAFHYGRGFGAHAPFDFWPARRETIVDRDHRVLLDAINDRGITRLAIPDRQSRDIEHRPKEEDAALDRIVTAIVYSPTGRVDAADFSIRGADKRTEYNARQVLQLAEGYPEEAARKKPPSGLLKERDSSYRDWINRRRSDTTSEDRERAEKRRKALQDETGLSSESYRFESVQVALRRF